MEIHQQTMPPGNIAVTKGDEQIISQTKGRFRIFCTDGEIAVILGRKKVSEGQTIRWLLDYDDDLFLYSKRPATISIHNTEKKHFSWSDIWKGYKTNPISKANYTSKISFRSDWQLDVQFLCVETNPSDKAVLRHIQLTANQKEELILSQPGHFFLLSQLRPLQMKMAPIETSASFEDDITLQQRKEGSTLKPYFLYKNRRMWAGMEYSFPKNTNNYNNTGVKSAEYSDYPIYLECIEGELDLITSSNFFTLKAGQSIDIKIGEQPLRILGLSSQTVVNQGRYYRLK